MARNHLTGDVNTQDLSADHHKMRTNGGNLQRREEAEVMSHQMGLSDQAERSERRHNMRIDID